MASAFQVRQAGHVLRKGGIIIYPTDTIYGLGCDPFEYRAVAGIIAIKQRPASKSMILLAADTEQLNGIVKSPDDVTQDKTAPTTWVMQADTRCPAWLRATDNTVAVRLTDHPVVKGLCDALGSPIISTSANFSGQRPARNSLDIHRLFHGMVDAVLIDDSHSTGTASIIRHHATRQTLR